MEFRKTSLQTGKCVTDMPLPGDKTQHASHAQSLWVTKACKINDSGKKGEENNQRTFNYMNAV